MSNRLSSAGAGCLLLLGAATASAVEAPRPARAPVPASSPHVSVRLVPGAGDFDGTLLQARPVESCAGTSFAATFTAEADGTVPLTSLMPAVSGWPGGTAVAVTPASASLQPGEQQAFALVLTVPASLAAGTYGATLELADVASGAQASAPATFRRCDAPHAGVRIVADGGKELVFGAGADGCAGTRFAAHFTVESTGTSALKGVRPAIGGFPAGALVTFQPESADLAPGESAGFEASLLLPGALLPGRYEGLLAVADRDRQADGSIRTSFNRCDAPRAGLRIIAGSGEELVFTAGANGCAGTGFAAHFTVESTGTVALKDVRPTLAGFPAGALVSFQPEAADLAPGERVGFEASLTLPETLNPGHYEGLLAVADRERAASSAIRASFDRCEVLLPGLRILLEDEEATALLLLPGETGCSGDRFHARFAVAASGTAPLERVTPRLDGLASGLAAAFTPPSARIGPGETASFDVAVTVAKDLPPGSYRSALVAADGASGVEEKVGATLERCAPPRPGVRLVLPAAAPLVRFAPGPAGCTGTSFHASVAVESTGSVAIAALTPTLTGLPEGIVASFNPPSLALAPGAKDRFEVSLTVATSLAPGGYTAILAVADAASGAGDAATASFERCAAPRPALRIVAGGRGEVTLIPRTDCSGDAFSAEIRVENQGDVPLAAVGLGIQGFPATIAVTVTPPALSLKPGEGQVFTLALAGASTLPAGSVVAALTARDGATGAADSSVARLDRCARPVDRPREDPGDDGDDQPLPLSRLTLEHTTSKSAVGMGEVLTYTLVLRNVGPVAIRELDVVDALPPGFRHVRGRTALDGRAFDDPEGTNRCRFRIAELGEGRSATLSFQAVVGPGVPLGKAVARATVRSRQASAGPVDAVVEVTRGSLEPFGIVRGSVRFAGGAGVAGVRLLLDSDREVATGEDGRFEFPGTAGGEHLVSLDVRTLGPGDRVSGDDSRLFHLFEGGSVEVEFRLVPRPTLGLKLDRLLAVREVEQKEMAGEE